MYRFQQRISGVKVLNGQAVVDDPVGRAARPGGRLEQARNRGSAGGASREGARDPDRISRCGREARAWPPVGEPGDCAQRRWNARLARRHPLRPAAGRLRGPRRRRLRPCGAYPRPAPTLQPGHAKLYDPNPVAERHSFFGGLRSDHKDRNTRLLTSLRVPVTLPHIRGGQNCLLGRWVHAKVGRHPAHDVCKASLRWNSVKRSKDRFEGLMTYFHINRAESYIQSLGFGDATGNGIDDRTQVAVADAFKDDNSFYSPGDSEDQVRKRWHRRRRGRRRHPARVRPLHPGRPGPVVRGRPSRPDRSARASATSGRP